MRLKEIEQRLNAIKVELETRGAEMAAEELEARETEVKELQEERKGILDQQEKRTKLLAALATGEEPDDGNGNPTPVKVIRTFDGKTEERKEDKYESMEYRKAFMDYVVRGTAIPAEYRQNANTATTDVGAVIPTNVLNQIIQKMESVGKVLALVTRTAYKGGVTIPKNTVKPVATWVSEGAGSDKQKGYGKGDVTFTYHKLRCAVAVSLEVDTMSVPAFESLIVNNIVEAMTKALEQSVISGDGNGKPKGIIKETAPDGQNLNVDTQKYDDLINAEAALPVAYEQGAVWCMSKKTYMGYYGLRDSDGQPIGRINYGIAGQPEYTLLGRPVVVVDYLPSFAAATAKSSTAGDVFAFLFNFKDYVLNTNYAMGIKKYEDNDTDDMVTKGIMLADGKVVDENSLVTLTKVTKAA